MHVAQFVFYFSTMKVCWYHYSSWIERLMLIFQGSPTRITGLKLTVLEWPVLLLHFLVPLYLVEHCQMGGGKWLSPLIIRAYKSRVRLKRTDFFTILDGSLSFLIMDPNMYFDSISEHVILWLV